MKLLLTEKRRTKAERMIGEVLEHPPETWLKYQHQKGGLFDIVAMEAGELAKARSDGTHEEVVVALSHLAAATMHAINKMTCP